VKEQGNSAGRRIDVGARHPGETAHQAERETIVRPAIRPEEQLLFAQRR
jgi:hypothetical protein